jgi:uncharacterized OB-fold protein
MSELSEAYWRGAAEGRLVLQRCADCGRVRHYPQLLCPACQSIAVEHIEGVGTGTVHSWTVAHHAFSPDLVDEVPYVLVTVDLPEGVRMLGRLSGEEPPSIGLPVRVTFAPDAEERPLPVFVPDRGAP